MVFNDYIKLSDDEKRELKSLIQIHEAKPATEQLQERGRFNEEIKRIMGPTSAGFCSACGRG